MQQARRAELVEVFDKAQARSHITIGGKPFLPRADQAVKICGGLDWDQVQRYFLELTGEAKLPPGTTFTIKGKNGAADVVGTRYTVTNTKGESFTLRDAARSTDQSGPVWTIDVPKSMLPTNYKGAPEIKFGKSQ